MSATAPEAARRAHEDLERLLHLCADALSFSGSARAVGTTAGAATSSTSRFEVIGAEIPRTSRDAEHLACGLLDLARDRCAYLAQMHQPAGTVEAEHAAAMEAENNDPLSAFYTKLRELKAVHHSRGADREEPADGAVTDTALLMIVPGPPEFSGEEGNGRYVDLHAHFATYVNVVHALRSRRKRMEATTKSENTGKRPRSGADEASAIGAMDEQKMDYLAYVKTEMTDFTSVPPSIRNSPGYRHYLSSLLAYLESFADRAHPLSGVREDISRSEMSLKSDLYARLAKVRDRFKSPEEALQGMGANDIREELLMLGLKCGGSPLDRARRLFDASQCALPTEDDSISRPDNPIGKQVLGERVVLEGLIGHIMEKVLAEERRATVLNIEKKQSLSWIELEAERVAEEAIAERGALLAKDRRQEEDEEVEQPVYNPKDVPLGWDGKPIPYWLYKLHGLNHEFKCEICGEATYKGPRAFERHFTDAQHVNGLRCLGVNYSKHYYMVTRIADVQRLREKIKKDLKSVEFDAEAGIEYEDNDGNVMNRKTISDLQRQGLL
jgi:splicing factor 3A subunit 3